MGEQMALAYMSSEQAKDIFLLLKTCYSPEESKVAAVAIDGCLNPTYCTFLFSTAMTSRPEVRQDPQVAMKQWMLVFEAITTNEENIETFIRRVVKHFWEFAVETKNTELSNKIQQQFADRYWLQCKDGFNVLYYSITSVENARVLRDSKIVDEVLPPSQRLKCVQF